MNRRIYGGCHAELAAPPQAVTARGVPLRRREPTRRPQTVDDGEDGKPPGATLQSWGKSELARGNDALKTATHRSCEDPGRDFYRLSRRQTVVAHEQPAEDSGSLPNATRPQAPPSLRPLRPLRDQTDEIAPLSARRGCPRPIAGRSLRPSMAFAHSMLTALRHPACADQSAETDRCPSNAGSRGVGNP